MKLKAVTDYLNKNGGSVKKANATILIVAIALSGCATSSKDISTNYVSPVQFQS